MIKPNPSRFQLNLYSLMYTAQYDQTYSTQVLTKPLFVDVHRIIWSNLIHPGSN